MADALPTARLAAWAKQNKGVVGAVGVGGLAGAFMLLRKRTQATAATDAGTVTTTGTSQPAYGSAAYYDSTASDLYNALTPQIQGLQQQLAALQAGPVSSPSPTDKPDLAGYPGSGQLWSTFESQQVASGQFVGKTGYEDWGVIAANVLGPSATRLEVLTEAQKLQALNPTAPKDYVPTSQVGSLKTS